MARKNMWSASAAVGDAELRGVPEGYAPEHDGTIELPRAMPRPSSNVYTVGRLGGAHRRSDKPAPSRSSGQGRSSGSGRSGRDSQDGEWTSIWPDEQPAGSRQAPQPRPQQQPVDDRWTTTTTGGRVGYDAGPSGYDRGPYAQLPAAYDAGPSGYPLAPVDRPSPSSRPTSGSRTAGSAGSRRRPKAGSRRSPSRPMRYTGARRKFSSWAPLGGGVLMLVLVLGATMLAEADRYTGNSSSALTSRAPARRPPAGATPSSGTDQQTTPASAPAAEAVATAINKELDNLGCGRVEVDQTLVAAAGDRVDDMLSRNYFDTKTADGDSSLDRAKGVGYDGTKVVESVVAGAGDPAEAARAAFPAPDADETLPATVKVVSGGTLTCGWTAVGAEARMNTKSVAYWSIVLGQ